VAADRGAEIYRLAEYLLEARVEDMPDAERVVIARAAQRLAVSRPVHREFETNLGIGQRLADRVAAVGGSWGFILGFFFFLVVWTGSNAWLLARPFDPYPFIFLNLMLSMLAAVQAPIIMMSQNRQAARDRVQASQDFKINLKAELEILALHDKLDRLLAASPQGRGQERP